MSDRIATRAETLTVARKLAAAYGLSPVGEFDDVRVIARREYDGRPGHIIVCDYVDMVQVSDTLRGTLKAGAWSEPINSSILAVYVSVPR